MVDSIQGREAHAWLRALAGWWLAFAALLAGALMAAKVEVFSIGWWTGAALGFGLYVLLARAAIRAMAPSPDALWRADDAAEVLQSMGRSR